MSDEIRIYVADLAAYNAGHLHGVWINACDELDDIKAQINEMLAASPEGFAEEYPIHDYEGFGSYALSEYAGIGTAHEVACFIAEPPDFGGELLNHFGGNMEEAKTATEDNYCGYYKSLADYAQETDRGNDPDSREPDILHRLRTHGPGYGDERRCVHRSSRLRKDSHFLESLKTKANDDAAGFGQQRFAFSVLRKKFAPPKSCSFRRQ